MPHIEAAGVNVLEQFMEIVLLTTFSLEIPGTSIFTAYVLAYFWCCKGNFSILLFKIYANIM